MKLHLGKGFSLDRDALRMVWSILAVRGAGKTYTSGVVIEEILASNLMPVVVIDPMDSFWGLKSSADGKSEGYPVIIMGGTHADVPLEPTAGAVVADFFITHRSNLILALKVGEDMWPKSQQVRFVADFCARLYQRNAGRLMSLVIDEADIFANQRPGKDELRCLGVMEDIVKRGRKPGIMPIQITQRSSNLNKNVLDETEMLVALRTTSPRDQDALDSWFRHLPREQQKRRDVLLETWSKLPNGTAYFWCPPMDLFQKVEIREKRTFDSSATPEFGEKPKEPKVVAPVDLEALTKQMAATIEKAKQEDPRLLRSEIAKLRAELSRTPQISVAKPVRVEVPVVTDAQVRAFAAAVERFVQRGLAAQRAVDEILAKAKTIEDRMSTVRADGAKTAVTVLRRSAAPVSPNLTPARPRRQTAEVVGDVRLKAGMRRMLDALARVHPQRLTRDQVATLAHISRNSGTFSDYFSKIGMAGLIEEQFDGTVGLTPTGVTTVGGIGHGAPPPEELRAMWAQSLKAGARRMLEELVAVYPQGLEKSVLGDRAGITPGSGTFSDYLSKLRSNGLAVVKGDMVWANEVLFMAVR